jgi:transketolase
MGDGETAEGSVWEAAHVAEHHTLDNLVGIVDVNGYGQSRATMWERRSEEHAARWGAFGWHVISIDGHDISQVLAALAEARRATGRPTAIIAKTLKGKGCSIFEDKPDWHGKALKKGKETDDAIAELNAQMVTTSDPAPAIPRPARRQMEGPVPDFTARLPAPSYKPTAWRRVRRTARPSRLSERSIGAWSRSTRM